MPDARLISRPSHSQTGLAFYGGKRAPASSNPTRPQRTICARLAGDSGDSSFTMAKRASRTPELGRVLLVLCASDRGLCSYVRYAAKAAVNRPCMFCESLRR